MSTTNPRSAVIRLGLGLSLLQLLLMPTPSTAGILDAAWSAPTTNTDGSPLTDLASYRVYYGVTSAPCPGSSLVQVASPSSSPGPGQTVSQRLTGLTAGAQYNVAVTAMDAGGRESACSSIASAVARADFALNPTGTVNFGSVSLGSFAEQTVTVSNTGGGTVSGAASVGAPFSIVSGSPFTLGGVGASQAIKVRFTPTTTTTVSTTLTIAAGGSTVSDIVTGSGSGADTTVPIVTIASPTSSPTYATSGSSLMLKGTASDNVGVTQVTWANSRGGSGTATGTSSWATNAIALQIGSNQLTVTARDAAGNMAQANLTVTLSDTSPPTIAVTTPVAGATLTSTVAVSGSATDNVGVAGVQFKLDGVNLGAEVTAAPYAVTWNTTATPDGVHVLSAVARDAAGNVATSGGVSMTVSNGSARVIDVTPPAISQVSLSVTSTGATIGWTTNEPSKTQVEYGVTNSYGTLAPPDTTLQTQTLQTSHSQVINGLAPNTWYRFRIRSRDAADNLGLSGDYRFKTRNR
jgi:Bacterial Ig domain/Purple acid Phosphatase, N-terminal domain/Abnormal spindle-like microcephaly-assoc'd, ASPM-SPD-2-Hydin